MKGMPENVHHMSVDIRDRIKMMILNDNSSDEEIARRLNLDRNKVRNYMRHLKRRNPMFRDIVIPRKYCKFGLSKYRRGENNGW